MRNKINNLLSFVVILIVAISAFPIISFAAKNNQMDLSNWNSITLANDIPTTKYPNWELDSAKTSVTQTVNGRAAAFIGDIECNNSKINGTFSVDTTNDDDFIGFVFGYRDLGHYYLFDWKQAEQQNAKQGMSVKLINTNDTVIQNDLYSTSGSQNKVELLYYNNVAYEDNTEYDFTLNFTNEGTFNIIIKKGNKVLDDIIIKDNTYTSGKFGFYNFSQVMVTYKGFTVTELNPVLKATAVSSKVDLTWSTVTDATSYTIKRSITAGGPYTTIATGITSTIYTDTDVTNGTTYFYVATAIVNGSEDRYSNEASATPQATTNPNQPIGNKALLVITMVTGERKEYEMTTDKINDFVAWYNSKAASSPTYVIEKDYNKASFTARKDYIAYEQISNFEVNEYNN